MLAIHALLVTIPGGDVMELAHVTGGNTAVLPIERGTNYTVYAVPEDNVGNITPLDELEPGLEINFPSQGMVT